jgi:hypothetical protein
LLNAVWLTGFRYILAFADTKELCELLDFVAPTIYGTVFCMAIFTKVLDWFAL